MGQFFRQLSKGTLAIIIIGAGILFIVLSDPPVTVCDAQVDVLKEDVAKFLYPNKNSKLKIKTTLYQRLRDSCKQNNSPGGCYELFSQLRNLERDIEKMPTNCRAKAGGLNPVRVAVWESLDLFVRLAWGEKPPVSFYDKLGWLDHADINLYCKLKRRAQQLWGKSRWERFREDMFKELPGASGISRADVWKKSILSLNCDSYL